MKTDVLALLITLSSLLLLFTGTVIAREYPVQYWESTVMKNQPMPEAMKILVVLAAAESQNEDNLVKNYHGYGAVTDKSKAKSSISSSTANPNHFVKDFDTSTNPIHFYWGSKSSEDHDHGVTDQSSISSSTANPNHFVKDFDSSTNPIHFYWGSKSSEDHDHGVNDQSSISSSTANSNHFAKDFDSSTSPHGFWVWSKSGEDHHGVTDH